MFNPIERLQMMERLRRFPQELEARLSLLSLEQLNTPFLAGEWSVAQNVHHLADSHMNSYIRLKLILTEQEPPLKPYDQDAWANFVDAREAPLDDSLAILRALHRRWVAVFESLREEDWQRIGVHGVSGPMSVEDLLQIYSAHCDAHLEQIERTLAAQPSA